MRVSKIDSGVVGYCKYFYKRLSTLYIVCVRVRTLTPITSNILVPRLTGYIAGLPVIILRLYLTLIKPIRAVIKACKASAYKYSY